MYYDFDTGVVKSLHFQSTDLREGRSQNEYPYSMYTFDNVGRKKV